MPISEGYKKNFQTLVLAAKNDDLALVECQDKLTGKPVYAVCATSMDDEGMVMLVPFAKLFDGDPYEELNPPMENPIEYRPLP